MERRIQENNERAWIGGEVRMDLSALLSCLGIVYLLIALFMTVYTITQTLIGIEYNGEERAGIIVGLILLATYHLAPITFKKIITEEEEVE